MEINDQNTEPVLENVESIRNTFSDHGNEIEEIISKKPPFILRWGTLLLFIIFLFIAAVCSFIKYPDIILAQAKLTSLNAPKPVVSIITGKLVKLNISENHFVKQGQILGYMESTANHNTVLRLFTDIDEIQVLLDKNKPELLQKYFADDNTQLGELQPAYQLFSEAYSNFKNYLSNGFYLHKKSMLAIDMDNLKKLHGNLLKQKDLNEQDLTLSQKTFNANESLNTDKVISDFDYRNEKSKLINKKLTLPQIANSIVSNEAEQNEKQKEIAELENTINEQKIIFQQALNTFRSELLDWKRKYLLVAPVDGRVAFAFFAGESAATGKSNYLLY